MKILLVDDDPIARLHLEAELRALRHEPVTAASGEEALRALASSEARVIISDWVMPGVDGLELCRRVRTSPDYVYFILFSQKEGSHQNERAAADAGVDDFLPKPVNSHDLWMRLRVAERILGFTRRVHELESILPICGYCKKIRDDQNYWQQIEQYFGERAGTEFSHSVCPDCMRIHIQPQLDRLGVAMPPLPPTKPRADRV
ncbi:MAG TPA: response regulator [Acidobacteriota bacterium]|nr:response regulator [Acidobacteriota bacterium]